MISKYELTQGQWERISGENPAAYPPGTVIGGRRHTLLHPVEQIRWKESMAMLGRVGLTMPTEAQWEFAARGGSVTRFWTGDEARSLAGAANLADKFARDNGGPASWRYAGWLQDGYVVHAPIGSFRPNAFGLHDTAGNVWEWCLDRFARYDQAVAAATGEREAPEQAPHVFRGGGFRAAAVHARSADRYSLYGAEYRAYDVGVRPARMLLE